MNSKHHSATWTAIAAVILTAGTLPAQGQEAASAADSTRDVQRIDFSIAPQSLTSALTAFAEQSGLRFAYSADMTRGLNSAGLRGRMEPTAALRQLLTGTGLTFRFTADRTVTIEKAPADARVLGPVRVEGAESTRINGVNGSTDLTATEGSGSYTSGALSIASKMPQSIQDTPQSVSVITQQRMQDQNLTDLASTLNQATGITLVQTGSLSNNFFSRGFQITRFQIDGGAPLDVTTTWGFFPLIDMAQYDHVEVLRGADGLFNGYGSPGGAINLTRKRPLDHRQLVLEGAAGSWGNRRMMVDVTSPLGFEARLRGRAVISYQDQDFFYKVASNHHTLAYGIIEADLTPDTTLGIGGSSARRDAVPWGAGLPRYSNGDDLQLSREVCLCTDWSRWDFDTQELFAQLEQRIGGNAALTLKLTQVEQDSRLKYGYVFGTASPNTGSGPILYGSLNAFATRQNTADLTFRGAFDVFGRRHEITVGGNYMKADGAGKKNYGSLFSFPYPAVDVFDFEPSAYPEPASTAAEEQFPEMSQTQWGAYANLKIALLEPLHLNAGIRWSGYESDAIQQSLDLAGNVTHESRNRYEGRNVSPPHLGLTYDVARNWSLYVGYASIYASQAYLLDKSGRPLDPLTGGNWELGVKGDLFEGRVTASLAGYRIEQKNFPLGDDSVPGTFEGGISCCYYALGDSYIQSSRGVDLEIAGEVLSGLQLSAGYTYNVNEYKGRDSEEKEGDPLSTYTPKHLLKLWANYRLPGEFWSRVTLGAGINAQTDSYNTGSACTAYEVDPLTGFDVCQDGATVDYEYTQGSYAIFSARIGYEIDTAWRVALNVENLTDRIYYKTPGSSDGGNWYGEPQNFMLTVRGQF